MKIGELLSLSLEAVRVRGRLKRMTGKAGPPRLLFRTGGIGDAVCAFPAALGLREKYPDSPLVFATYPAYRSLVEMSGCADAFLPSDWTRPLMALYGRLFAGVYHPRTEEETPTGLPTVHLVDDFCRKIGVAPVSRQPRLQVSEADRARMQEKLRPVRAGDGPVIALHAGPSWRVRSWPQAHWNVLAAQLRAEGMTPVQVGADSHLGVPTAGDRVAGAVDWVGQFSLTESAALLAACDGFIGIDSGLLHVAGAVGTPCVGLFGPVLPELRLPPETPSVGVTAGAGAVPCLGCHHRRPALHWIEGCPHEIVCMQKITPAQVRAALDTLLHTLPLGSR